MALFFVSYDLRTPDHDYTPFFIALRGAADMWWHFLTNTWLVTTNLDVDVYTQLLMPHITTQDSLLVMEVKGWGQGWLPREAWDWIRKNST